MKTIVGRCSNCGGSVTVPDIWLGTYPPTPTCDQCGATKKSDKPVVDMDPPPKRRWQQEATP